MKLPDGQQVQICDLCRQNFNENKYCDFCYQIYQSSNDDAEMDGRVWVQCEECEKWNHNDHEKHEEDAAAYYCLKCRIEKWRINFPASYNTSNTKYPTPQYVLYTQFDNL